MFLCRVSLEASWQRPPVSGRRRHQDMDVEHQRITSGLRTDVNQQGEVVRTDVSALPVFYACFYSVLPLLISFYITLIYFALTFQLMLTIKLAPAIQDILLFDFGSFLGKCPPVCQLVKRTLLLRGGRTSFGQ